MPLVIQDIATGERFLYPYTNENIETPEGFVQVQSVPRGFQVSSEQDSSGLPHFHHVYPSHPAESDPLK